MNLPDYMTIRQAETDQLWERLTTHPIADELVELFGKVSENRPLNQTERTNVAMCLRLIVTEVLLRLHRKEISE